MKSPLSGQRGRTGSIIVALAFLASCLSLASANPPDRYELADLKALEQAFADLAQKVRPSVVAVRTYRIRHPGSSDAVVKLPISQGSGFLIDPSGYIATNRHVIDGASSIMVIVDSGQRYDATVVKYDERSDLAVLKIEGTDLPYARLGDVAKVKVNQWAFASGNPFGLANADGRASVTYGVVSALGRQMTDRLPGNDQIHYYGNLIETSAAINPGSSGGPLFNLDGEVIGVVTAIESSSGVNEGHGFAIPIDKNTRSILETLKAGKEVRYGFLGVNVDDVEPPESRQVVDTGHFRGAKITRVDPPNGPAGAAGLKAGDVIVEFDDMLVEGKDHLVRLVGFTPVGSEVNVTYLRRQVRRKATVTIADRHQSLGLATPNE